MNRWQLIYILLQLSHEIWSNPLQSIDVSSMFEEPELFEEYFEGNEQDPELSEDYFEGDIQFPTIEMRNGLRSEILRWPNATVYYHISDGQFDKYQVNYIHRAMQIISSFSCISFESPPQSSTYFLIIASNKRGCSVSRIGWENNIRYMNLERNSIGQGCFRIGSILHELLHVLGFKHQHVAANRDEYVYVHWKNIRPQFLRNFINNHELQPLDSFGEEYDYESVMHYPRNAFSIDRQHLWTLEPIKPGGELMGQRLYISEKDIKKLNRMYKCHEYL